MSEGNAIDNLRKILEEKVTDTFEAGTVIRWVSRGKYSFAALKVDNGFWYLTGGAGMYGSASQTYDDLVSILELAEVSDILVSTGWEAL